MATINLYWYDLKRDKQVEILRKVGDNGNWDAFPIASIDVEDGNFDVTSCYECGEPFVLTKEFMKDYLSSGLCPNCYAKAVEISNWR